MTSLNACLIMYYYSINNRIHYHEELLKVTLIDRNEHENICKNRGLQKYA